MVEQRALAVEVCPCGTRRAKNGYEILLIANKHIIRDVNINAKKSECVGCSHSCTKLGDFGS